MPLRSNKLDYNMEPTSISTDISTRLSDGFSTALKEEQLLDIEETNKLLDSQSPKQLANKGLAIINLTIGSMRTGLGGRTIITLELDPAVSQKGQELDMGEIRTGDIVRISSYAASADTKKKGQPSKAKQKNGSDFSTEKKGNKSKTDGIFAEGVVSINANSLNVAIEDEFSDNVDRLDGRLWLVKLTNNATYKRMNFALKALKENSSPTRVHSIILGKESPTIPTSLPNVKFFDDTLNDPQKEAVKFSLSECEVTLIHGPPGTGKTYTLIEIIRQLVAQEKRVLVCGPSNVSVDNILERLHGNLKGNKLIRIGHPARLFQTNRIHSLDIISKSGEYGEIINGIQEEIDQNLRKISKTRSGMERKKIYGDIKELRKDYRIREKKVLANIILEAQVVVSTLHGAGSYSLRQARMVAGKPLFDVIIIDEVSQSLEAQCWIPLMDFPSVTKVIVAGDNRQLPPVVMTKEAKSKSILERTLFDRLEKLHYGKKIIKLLPIQYRMHKKIMEFPSEMFYESKLIADKSVAERLLIDFPDVKRTEETESPVVWIDTQGDDFFESNADDSSEKSTRFEFSKSNENEAQLVKNYTFMLIENGVNPLHIGIIAPYSAQIALLRRLVHEKYETVEIATVDGFQGREKDVIILSLVRSNEKGEVGFLGEERRLNVAMTRPKRHLCIVGNSETIARGSKFLKKWVTWAEDNAELQFPDIGDILSSQ